MTALSSSEGVMDSRVAAVFAMISAALLGGAVVALVVGWFWAAARGDWQAIALWSYWLGAPALSGVSMAAARKNRLLKRLNAALLGVWGMVSLLVLVVPLL